MITVWQKTAWQHLQQSYLEKRFPHALLLANTPDTYQLEFAQALAGGLLCLGNDVQTLLEPCGKCTACHWREQGSHPDFRLLAPEDNSRVIKVDAIRSLMEWSYTTAHQARPKVAIFSPANALHPAAANALLKTLEEPNTDSVWILITDKLHSLPITLRSRCQRVFWRVPEAEILSSEMAGLQRCLTTWKIARDPLQVSEAWSKMDFAQVISVMLLWIEEVIRVMLNIPVRHTAVSDVWKQCVHTDHQRLQQWFAFRDELLRIRKSLSEQLSFNTALCLDVFCCRLWTLMKR